MLTDDSLQETMVFFTDTVPERISGLCPSNCYCKFSFVSYEHKANFRKTRGAAVCGAVSTQCVNAAASLLSPSLTSHLENNFRFTRFIS